MNVPELGTELSDVPETATGMSPLLAYSLKIHDLSEMTDLLLSRGIRTLNSLHALGLWQLHRKLSGDLATRIACLFETRVDGHSPIAVGRVFPRPRDPHVLELPQPLSDETCLMHSRRDTLGKVRHVVGDDRYNEAIKLLLQSDELAMASCLAAAQALSALGIRKEEVQDGEHKELLKAAKLSLRDVLLMRSIGCALGFDSRKAVVRTLEHVCGHTSCDANTLSQLGNGYHRILEELSRKLLSTPPATVVEQQNQNDCVERQNLDVFHDILIKRMETLIAEAFQRQFRMIQCPPEVAPLDVDSESSFGALGSARECERMSSCHHGKCKKNRRKKNKTLCALKSLQRMVKRLHDEVSSLKDRDVDEVLQPSNDFVTIYRSCRGDHENQLTVSPGDRVVITEWHSGGWAFGRKVNAAPGPGVERGFFPYWCLNKHDNVDNTTYI